ncbi:MAG: peptidoglycan-binding domain-containing protein, partial [Pseudomonadota bacterium]
MALAVLLTLALSLSTLSLPGSATAQTRGQIAAAQGALTQAGYDAGPADGLMGPKTRGALADWQRDRGLPADGTLDPATLARLTGAQPEDAPDATNAAGVPPIGDAPDNVDQTAGARTAEGTQPSRP